MSSYKPKGYHLLANLMGPYPETAIFRRFGPLNMLNLMSLQAELLSLQASFEDMCEEDDNAGEAFSIDFRALRETEFKPNNDQYQTLLKIRYKLREYNLALLEVAEISKLSQPSEPDLNFLRDWLGGEKQGNAFLKGSEAFTWDLAPDPPDLPPTSTDIEKQAHAAEKERLACGRELLEQDLVILQPSGGEDDAFSRWLSGGLLDWYHRVIGHRRKDGIGHKEVDPESGIMRYSDSALVRFNTVVVTVVSSAIPVLAIVALYFVQTTVARIGVLVAFTVIFALALAAFTDARRLEIFASTSAFVAIEVIFIGTVLPGTQ